MKLIDMILAVPFERVFEPIEIPQWPGTTGKLFVRTLSAIEDERRQDAARKAREDPSVCFLAEVAALVLVDENKELVFTTKEQIAAIAAKSSKPLEKIANKYYELRGSVDDAEKKSEPSA